MVVTHSVADTSQLSQGAVAGVVIVTLILLTLATAGVVIGIVFWVYQPWSNGWFGLEEWITKRRAKGLSLKTNLILVYII